MTACTVIGSGQQTLVPAKAPATDKNSGFRTYFPDLVYDDTTPQLSALRAITPDAETDRSEFKSHLTDKLGNPSTKSLTMSLVVRERTKTPPFLPVDIDLDKSLLSVYLNKDLTTAQKNEMSDIANARILNVPDIPRRTTIQAGQPGQFVYFYYPRVKLGFSSKVQSPSSLDRIAYLGMAVELRFVDSKAAQTYFESLLPQKDLKARNEAIADRQRQCDAVSDHFRLIDFQPKESDILGFTRGQLTQAAEIQSKATFSDKEIDKIATSATTGMAPETSTSSPEHTAERALTPELTATFSETFVNELKDSIEARTAGFLKNGQAFFADFRSIKERRIGGTYDFDLMLEVPAFTYEGASIPCGNLEAEAFLIGIVRHVYDRGFTGRVNKVPEPQNDDAFHEVITQHIEKIKLWQFDRWTWGNAPQSTDPQFVVTVISNDADAQFVARRRSDNQVIGSGSGKSSKISLSPDAKNDFFAKIEFLDVNRISEGEHHTLSADESDYFRVTKAKAGSRTVIGNYK